MFNSSFVKPILFGTLLSATGLAMADAASDPATLVDGLKLRITATATDIKSDGTAGGSSGANGSVGYGGLNLSGGYNRSLTAAKADTAIGVTRINQAKASNLDVEITATAANVSTTTNANSHIGVLQIGKTPD